MVAALYEFTHVCTQSFYVLATLSDNGTSILSREAVIYFDGISFVELKMVTKQTTHASL